MRALRWRAVLALAIVVVAATPARAQQVLQLPHINYAYPAGGQPGTTFEVTVGGQFFRVRDKTGKEVFDMEHTLAHISGKGVKATIVKYFKPFTQGDAARIGIKLNEARLKLVEEQTKQAEERKKAGLPAVKPEPLTQEKIARAAGVTDEELELQADYRKRQADVKRQLNPQIAEEITLKVRISADVRPGERELRLLLPTGLTNPLYFMIGQFPEIRETEPNDRTPDSAVIDQLPVIINGQIMPGDVDRFKFHARRGQRLVAIGAARELIPYLADAVPGWFQAVLTLYDAQGNEVAYAAAFGFRQDPVLFYEVPQDGDYTLQIRDAIFRGREDFVYRITLGEIPFVTNVFPLGGRQGTHPSVALKGSNLAADTLSVDAYYDRAFAIRTIGGLKPGEQRGFFNKVPFQVDMLGDCLEQEPNDDPQTAQAVTLPVIINGRVDKPGDVDMYRFEGRSGDRVIAEVYARRLGSPLDSLLKLIDSSGKVLAMNDDYEDKGAALSTHHADSRISVTLPTSGAYFVRLIDSQHKGGPDYAYRLHIRPPRPDFELRVVPSSVIARAGTTVPIAVYALRRDDFAEDIQLDLEGSPKDFKLSGALVPGNQDKVRLTLTVPPTATDEPISLQMEGHAQVKTRKISHLAVPAEAMTQAFAYQHLVIAKDWTVAVTGKPGGKPQIQISKDERIKLPSGGTTSFRATTPGRAATATLGIDLSEPPDGITIQKISPDSEGIMIQLAADAAKIKPGLKGNLIFNAYSERTITAPDKKPATQRSQLGVLPAIPFEVTGPDAK